MAKKKKKDISKITQEDVHNINVSANREEQKKAGFFDGRFKTRSEESNKVYTRNKKHPKQDDND